MTKSCDSGATKSAPGLTECHAASAEPEEKSSKKGDKKVQKGDEKVQKEGQKRFETASTREIKAAFPEKTRNSHSVMINSRFPPPDHKLVTGDPVQILLGNV